MDFIKLIKIGNIPPKKKVLINYFRICNSMGENYDYSSVVNFQKEDDIFDSEEFQLLTSPSGKDNVEMDKWNNIISLMLRIDIVAEKYYYQTISEIYLDLKFNYRKLHFFYIRNCYFNYIFNTFTVLLINQIFYDLIKVESPELLRNIPVIEKTINKDTCFLFRNEYLTKKSEVIKNARGPVDEIINIMKEYEFISENLMKNFIDKVDNQILKSFELI
ncbi:MAG: hypothetical protein WC894_04150 [Patescibacteria group bacterium]